MVYSPQQIYSSLLGQGATPAQASTLTSISGAESGFGANLVSSVNRNGSQDYGVFQVNNAAWPQYGGSAIANAPLDQQSAAALHIYNTQGPTAWSTYNNGSYLNFSNGSGGSGTGAAISDGDFIDPNFDYTGAQNTVTASSFDSGSALAPGLSGSGTVGYNATTPGASGLGGGSGLFDNSPSPSGDSVTYANPGSSDIGDFYPDASTAAGSTAGGAVSAVAGAGGAPVNITDLPGLDQSVSGAGKAVQTGAGTIGTDVQQSAGGIAGTAASIFNNAQTYFSGAVAVIALVILGLVFVAFGLGMFKHNLAAAV